MEHSGVDVANQMGNCRLSVLILTYNEEIHLPHCLDSLKDLNCEVIVVDSGSTDRTAQIAEEAGAQFIHHSFKTQAQQLNWALEHITFRGEWIFRLDADEWATPELTREINTVLGDLDSNINGLYIKRRVYFMGRWMRHGGYYPTWIMRLWRKECAVSEDRIMDEHMVLVRGQSSRLQHDIVDENRKGLFVWTERQNSYSSREVVNLLKGPSDGELCPNLLGTPELRRRWLKYHVFLGFPPFLRVFLYYIFRYFFLFGFLDGKQGFVFHFLHGFWYRFLIDAKVYEASLSEKGDSSPKD